MAFGFVITKYDIGSLELQLPCALALSLIYLFYGADVYVEYRAIRIEPLFKVIIKTANLEQNP